MSKSIYLITILFSGFPTSLILHIDLYLNTLKNFVYTHCKQCAFFLFLHLTKRNLYQLHAELHICGHMQRTEYRWDYMWKTDFWTSADTGHWIGAGYISQKCPEILSRTSIRGWFLRSRQTFPKMLSPFSLISIENLDWFPSSCRLVAGFWHH